MQRNNITNSPITSIETARIARDPETQARHHLNEDVIAEYAECLEDLPPIDIMQDARGVLRLVDGWHRLRAHEKAGRATIRARVMKGDREAAIEYAAGANAGHGLRRTNDDKRRAVELVLARPNAASRSNRDIARACRVSEHTVADVRRRAQMRREAQSLENPVARVDALASVAGDEIGECAEAFARIRDGKLYRDRFGTFEAYVRDVANRFGADPEHMLLAIDMLAPAAAA